MSNLINKNYLKLCDPWKKTLILSDHGTICFSDCKTKIMFKNEHMFCEIQCVCINKFGKIDFVHSPDGSPMILDSFTDQFEELIEKVLGGCSNRSFGVVKISHNSNGIAFFDETGTKLLSSDIVCDEILVPAIILGKDVRIDKFNDYGIKFGYCDPNSFEKFIPMNEDQKFCETVSKGIKDFKDYRFFLASYSNNPNCYFALAFHKKFKNVNFNGRYGLDIPKYSCVAVVSTFESVHATELYQSFCKIEPPIN